MRKIVCFIFIPSAYVGLDNLIPFIIRLKKIGWTLHTVIIEAYMEETLNKALPYLDILKKNSTIHRIGHRSGGNSLSKALSLIKFLSVLWKIFLTSEPRIITCVPIKGIFYKILDAVSHWKGRFYYLTKSNTPVPANRYKAEADTMQNLETKGFLNKKSTGFKHRYIGTYLMHSEWESDVSEILGHKNSDRVIIGYPKLYSDWRDYLETYKIPWDVIELKQEKQFFTIVLSNPRYYYYAKGDAADVLLREVILVIRQYFEDMLIVLKPKVRASSKADTDSWVQVVLDDVGDKRVVKSYSPIPFLARKSAAAFSLGETTGLFDFLIRGLPCVEHCRYSRDYLKIYPKGSFWGELVDLRRTATQEELYNAVREIKQGTFRTIGTYDLITKIEHRENNASFRIL